MVSTYNDTIIRYPSFRVPYLEGTDPLDLGIPSTGKQALAFSEREKP
jgi:hypothetical protein